jgi:hypothetical protein
MIFLFSGVSLKKRGFMAELMQNGLIFYKTYQISAKKIFYSPKNFFKILSYSRHNLLLRLTLFEAALTARDYFA